eukprot:1111764-Pyramimonas_sp.AAC.1
MSRKKGRMGTGVQGSLSSFSSSSVSSSSSSSSFVSFSLLPLLLPLSSSCPGALGGPGPSSMAPELQLGPSVGQGWIQ